MMSVHKSFHEIEPTHSQEFFYLIFFVITLIAAVVHLSFFAEASKGLQSFSTYCYKFYESISRFLAISAMNFNASVEIR